MRALIIRPGALGDTLLLLPALNDLAGKVSVTFVGRQPGLDFIRPHVDRAMDLEGSGWRCLFMDQPDPVRLPVPERDIKIAVAFFSDPDGLIQRNLRASLPHAAVHLFRSFPPGDKNIHVAEYLGGCLTSAGLPVDPARSMEAVKNGALFNWTRPSEKRARIVLHPGSGSPKKNHPPGLWIDLASRFSRDPGLKGLQRVFLLGPAESTLHAHFVEYRRSGDAEILLSSNRELLMETLDRAALFLGHDSGITHLSAMHCIPTVALFKKNNATQWRPLGPFVRVIEGRDPDMALLQRTLEAAGELVRSVR